MRTFKSYLTEDVSRQFSLSTLLFNFGRHSVDDVKIRLGS